MTRSRLSLRGSQPGSPGADTSSEEDDLARSPKSPTTPALAVEDHGAERGRGRPRDRSPSQQIVEEMEMEMGGA